jgi:amino acid adenylation domain-containing protein
MEHVEGFELSPQQARAWRFREAGFDSVVALSIVIDGNLQQEPLRARWLQLCLRHEILRTRFERLPGLQLPVQIIDPTPRVCWNDADGGSGPAHARVRIEPLSASKQRLTLQLAGAWLDTGSLWRLLGEWLGTGHEEAPLQYADYAAWRVSMLEDPHASALWRSELAARTHATVLPLGAGISPHGNARLQTFSAATGLAADEEGALRLLACWIALLHQHTEAQALTLGLDWQAHDPRFSTALGLFGEAWPLTLRDLEPLSFSALLAAVTARVQDLQQQGDAFPSTDDVQPYTFGFRYVAAPASLANIQVEHVVSCTAPHRLLLELQAGPVARVNVLFDPQVYTVEAVAALAEQCLTLWAASAAHPDTPLRQLPSLSESARATLRTRVSRADALSKAQDAVYQRTLQAPSLVALFDAAIAGQPDALAVSGRAGSYSYAELAQRVERLAQHLLAHAPRRVGHFLPRTPDAVVAMLAILEAGATYVPIDPDYPAERIQHMLADSQVDLLVTERALAARLPDDTRHVYIDDPGVPPAERRWPTPVIERDSVAYIIYTSGSTGKPRGVPITHAGALYSLAARLAYYREPISGFLLLSSFAFDSSIAGLFSTLAHAGCLYVCDSEEQKDPARLGQIVRERGLSHMLALPSLYQLLLQSFGASATALRAVIVAGEACPPALVGEHHACLPDVELYNEYGATEASVWSTVARLRASEVPRPVSVGRPIPHSSLFVLDEAAQLVAAGVRGEVYVASPGLSPGYLGRPELTAEKFLRIEGERCYRTGDFGYWDERGELVFLGRADGQVKIRGYRIELGEIETELRRVTGAQHAVVLCDQQRDGEPFLRAFIESATGVDSAAVRAQLAQVLPTPMLPSALQTLPRLPRNANGKFDHRALLAIELERQRPQYVAPETAVQQRMAAIWAELLDAEAIGLDDDFFALGGHSLLAVKLVHRTEAQLGGSLPIQRVFAHPKLRDMANAIAAGTVVSAQIAQLRAGAQGSPLYCVDPTGVHLDAYTALAQALPDGQAVCGLSFSASSEPSVEALAAELASAVQAHSAGPYRLLGWSLGGALALAIARTIELRGGKVAFVGIVDSQPPMRLYAGAEPGVLEELAEYVDVDRRQAFVELPADVRAALEQELSRRSAHDRILAAVRWAQAHGFIRDRNEPAAFLHRYELLKSSAQYLNRLRAEPANAALHVWWSGETMLRHVRPPIDYRELTRGSVSISQLPGDHRASVESPVMHAQVARILEEAQ